MPKQPNSNASIKRKRQQAREMTAEQGEVYEIHHKHPRSRKRVYPGQHINEERNLSILRRVDHQAWHQLTKNQLPKEFVRRLNEEFMPPDWYLVAVPRHKPPQVAPRRRRYCIDCECEVLRHIEKTTKQPPVRPQPIRKRRKRHAYRR